MTTLCRVSKPGRLICFADWCAALPSHHPACSQTWMSSGELYQTVQGGTPGFNRTSQPHTAATQLALSFGVTPCFTALGQGPLLLSKSASGWMTTSRRSCIYHSMRACGMCTSAQMMHKMAACKLHHFTSTPTDKSTIRQPFFTAQ